MVDVELLKNVSRVIAYQRRGEVKEVGAKKCGGCDCLRRAQRRRY